MKLTPHKVPIGQLLLHPNNPRYFDLKDHEPVNITKFHEDAVQQEALKKLRDYGIDDLKRSIRTIGYIEFESVVVEEYKYQESYYTVIEGNRRVAAVKSILNDIRLGVLNEKDLPNGLTTIFTNFPITVFTGTDEEKMLIQGIRHVAGPKEWRPFQQARLVAALHDEKNQSFEQIQDTLGYKAQDIRRLYYAYNVFQQMRSDDEFGDQANVEYFSLFEEMLGRPSIRKWLGWSESVKKFTNVENTRHMYSLIVPTEIEKGETKRMISNPNDMRDFGRILAHENRDKVLFKILEGDLSIREAWQMLKPPGRHWTELVADCLEALSRLPADQLEKLTEEQEQLLTRLREEAEKKLKQVKALKAP